MSLDHQNYMLKTPKLVKFPIKQIKLYKTSFKKLINIKLIQIKEKNWDKLLIHMKMLCAFSDVPPFSL